MMQETINEENVPVITVCKKINIPKTSVQNMH